LTVTLTAGEVRHGGGTGDRQKGMLILEKK
jgi:hypothetical protein